MKDRGLSRVYIGYIEIEGRKNIVYKREVVHLTFLKNVRNGCGDEKKFILAYYSEYKYAVFPKTYLLYTLNILYSTVCSMSRTNAIISVRSNETDGAIKALQAIVLENIQ